MQHFQEWKPPLMTKYLVTYNVQYQILFQKTMSDNEFSGEGENNSLTDQERFQRELRKIKRRARSLSRNSRRRLGREHGIRFDDTDNSASSASESEASVGSDSSTGSNRDRRKKKDKYSMSRLLQNQQGVLQSVVQRVTDPDKAEDVSVRTATNTFSKKRINEAIQKERSSHYKNLTNEVQIARVPKIEKNKPAISKENRDAIQNLKDMQSARVTGEEVEGIHEYLSICARLATDTKLSTNQFFDLLRSRVDPKSTLYREITNNYRKGTPLKQLFKELCETYPGGTSYLASYKRYSDFDGAGMTASQFISKLKNAAHDLINATPHTVDKDTDIYNKVLEKVISILPSLASDIMERYQTAMRGDTKGDLAVFTSVFMKLSDKIEHILKPHYKKTIKLITETPTENQQYHHEDHARHLINALKLSTADVNRLKDKCYKCGSMSPLQKPDHYARECLAYKGDPLAMYLCKLCNLGVHLPSVCKQSTQGRALLEEKARELDIPLKIETISGQVFAIGEPEEKNFF